MGQGTPKSISMHKFNSHHKQPEFEPTGQSIKKNHKNLNQHVFNINKTKET